MNDIAIPKKMQRLERDSRGYPIPFITYKDAQGPHFTMRDEAGRQGIIKADLCSICGQKLNKARWFVGGPLCAFTRYGAFTDPPMHDECAHYALQVCPYLAAPNYEHIEDTTLPPQYRGRVFLDVNPIERPSLFVAIKANGTLCVEGAKGYVLSVKPTLPFLAIEYWRHGSQVGPPEDLKAREKLLLKVTKKEQQDA